MFPKVCCFTFAADSFYVLKDLRIEMKNAKRVFRADSNIFHPGVSKRLAGYFQCASQFIYAVRPYPAQSLHEPAYKRSRGFVTAWTDNVSKCKKVYIAQQFVMKIRSALRKYHFCTMFCAFKAFFTIMFAGNYNKWKVLSEFVHQVKFVAFHVVETPINNTDMVSRSPSFDK